jgi:ADP-dependent phosphofructokinase/glucokinase
MTTKNTYDPMQDFYKRAFEFLFRQSPVIVLAVLVLYLQWLRSERMDHQMAQYRIELAQQCSDALAKVRVDLDLCHMKNETLTNKVMDQAVELAKFKTEVERRWERARKQEVRPNTFGSKD